MERSQSRQPGAHPHTPSSPPAFPLSSPLSLGLLHAPPQESLLQEGIIQTSHLISQEEQAHSTSGTGPQLMESDGTEPRLPCGLMCPREDTNMEPEHTALTQTLSLCHPSQNLGHPPSALRHYEHPSTLCSVEQLHRSVSYSSQKVSEGP